MSAKSPHPISEVDIRWADLILVMEENQKSWIMGRFRHLQLPKIASLDIPDEYEYMNEELIDIIRRGVEHHLKRFEDDALLP